jgi:hypothetical protein
MVYVRVSTCTGLHQAHAHVLLSASRCLLNRVAGTTLAHLQSIPSLDILWTGVMDGIPESWVNLSTAQLACM